MYLLVHVNKNCCFSLEKGSLSPTCFLEFGSKLSQRKSQQCWQWCSTAGYSLQKSSPLLCSFLGQKMLFHIQKYPVKRLIQGIYKQWRCRDKAISPCHCLPSCWYERTHSPHCIIQQYQHIRKWHLLNSIFLFIPTKSFVKGHFCPSCI